MSTSSTGPGGPSGGQGQPSEQEMRAALEEQLRQVSVDDVLLQSVVSVINVAMRRTGLMAGAEGERDLEQVRTAVEAVGALMPLLERIAGDQAGALRDALSQLQMAYVRGREGGDAPGEPGGGEPSGGTGGPGGGGPGGGAGGGPQRPDEPSRREPGQSSGRLWIPGQ